MDAKGSLIRKAAINALITKHRTFDSGIINQHLKDDYNIDIHQSQVCRYIKQLQDELDPQIEHIATDGIMRSACQELIDIDSEIEHVKGLIDNTEDIPHIATLHKTLKELRERKEHIHHNVVLMPRILQITAHKPNTEIPTLEPINPALIQKE